MPSQMYISCGCIIMHGSSPGCLRKSVLSCLAASFLFMNRLSFTRFTWDMTKKVSIFAAPRVSPLRLGDDLIHDV